VIHDERQHDQKRREQKRPLTEEEKLDEAIAESFIGSDPPANTAPTRVGAPPKRKTPKTDDSKA
jgi:hypothetical protein